MKSSVPPFVNDCAPINPPKSDPPNKLPIKVHDSNDIVAELHEFLPTNPEQKLGIIIPQDAAQLVNVTLPELQEFGPINTEHDVSDIPQFETQDVNIKLPELPDPVPTKPLESRRPNSQFIAQLLNVNIDPPEPAFGPTNPDNSKFVIKPSKFASIIESFIVQLNVFVEKQGPRNIAQRDICAVVPVYVILPPNMFLAVQFDIVSVFVTL